MSRATLAMTIDELARQTGVTTRTIRAHQTAGLLPHARVRGRTAYYGDAHARRLAAVTRLQTRGWSRAAIREVLAAAEAGRSIAELLDVPGPSEAATQARGDWVEELFATYAAPVEPDALLPATLSN